MDFLFIFISIAGAVFAAVMLLFASRTSRMERESDARVEELQARATGSVLFVPDGRAESDEAIEAPMPLMDEVAPLRLQAHDLAGPEGPASGNEPDLAWDEMVDERVEKAATRDWAPEVQAPAHTFVLTVPAEAGRAQAFSFARTQRRSRT